MFNTWGFNNVIWFYKRMKMSNREIKMNKELYVMVNKPLKFEKFEKFNAPTGWIRIDILKRKLREDENYRKKFTQKECYKIIGK